MSAPTSNVNIMDKASSIAAALNAGKQPSQRQINAWADYFLQGPLLQVEQGETGGELSQNGKQLARDLRNVLETYKIYGEHKNGGFEHPYFLLNLRS